METNQAKYCDVVGCTRIACWICPQETNRTADDYLCQDHYDALLLRHPHQAECYVALSDWVERVQPESTKQQTDQARELAPL